MSKFARENGGDTWGNMVVDGFNVRILFVKRANKHQKRASREHRRKEPGPTDIQMRNGFGLPFVQFCAASWLRCSTTPVCRRNIPLPISARWMPAWGCVWAPYRRCGSAFSARFPLWDFENCTKKTCRSKNDCWSTGDRVAMWVKASATAVGNLGGPGSARV